MSKELCLHSGGVTKPLPRSNFASVYPAERGYRIGTPHYERSASPQGGMELLTPRTSLGETEAKLGRGAQYCSYSSLSFRINIIGMPELPEVQTIVTDLKRRIIGKKIADFWTDTPRIIKGFSPNDFKREVVGFEIADVQRRGKNILFYLEKTIRKRKDKKIMLAHQKMTGHFLIGRWRIHPPKFSEGKLRGVKRVDATVKGPIASDPYNQYIRVIFRLDNGWELGLSDLRKFARITVGPPQKIEHSKEIASLGPDALSPKFSPKYLFSVLQKRKKLIKPILLEQNVMAGVGNIYADEALFLAKINPQRKAAGVKRSEVERLVKSIKKVLQKSIRLKGTSVIDYRDTYGRRGKYDKVRWVYDKEKLPCRICRTLIKRVKIGQRSSYFCPRCQK